MTKKKWKRLETKVYSRQACDVTRALCGVIMPMLEDDGDVIRLVVNITRNGPRVIRTDQISVAIVKERHANSIGGGIPITK